MKQKAFSFLKLYMRKVLIAIAAIAVSAAVGLGILCLAFSLPGERIRTHVHESLQIFNDEGWLYNVHDGIYSLVDNWTDATIIIESALDLPGVSPLERALKCYTVNGYYDWGDAATMDVTIVHYFSDSTAIWYTWTSYARYWHGYIAYVRPLLELFNWYEIRTLNLVCQLALTALAVFLLWKKKLAQMILPFLLSYGILLPLVTAKCMQYSDCWYIILFAVIALLLAYDSLRHDRICYLFLGTGIVLAYVDFLTYPLATLGLPLIVYLMLEIRSGAIAGGSAGLRRGLCDIAESAFFWGIGYAGMWAAKWILAQLLTDEDVISDAISQVLYRTNVSTTGYETQIDVPYMLYEQFLGSFHPVTIAAIAFIVTALILWLIGRTCGENASNLRLALRRNAAKSNQIILMAVCALLPFVWYLALRQHSTQHWFFTCRSMIVFYLALMCMFLPNPMEQTKEEKTENKPGTE